MGTLQEAVAEFYSNPACNVGGPLHIVVDDGNVEEANIRWCCEIEQINEWRNAVLPYNDAADVNAAIADTFRLAAQLLAVSEDERADAVAGR